MPAVMVSYSELPASLRRKVDALEGPRSVPDSSGRQRKRDRKGADLVAMDGVCHACGERFTNARRWEEHADQTGHRRLDIVGGAAS